MSSLINTKLPEVTFKTRVKKDDASEYSWQDLPSSQIFAGKKVIVFSLPGAFTPTCSSTHLPGYEAAYELLKAQGVDEIYCLAVNDAFVMNAWKKDLNINKVKLIPDGNAEFTSKVGMLVKKENLGFGSRSWRYSMYVEDGVVKQVFAENGQSDNFVDDPFEVSDAGTMLNYLKNR
jgi:peroxiredoxin